MQAQPPAQRKEASTWKSGQSVKKSKKPYRGDAELRGDCAETLHEAELIQTFGAFRTWGGRAARQSTLEACAPRGVFRTLGAFYYRKPFDLALRVRKARGFDVYKELM